MELRFGVVLYNSRLCRLVMILHPAPVLGVHILARPGRNSVCTLLLLWGSSLRDRFLPTDYYQPSCEKCSVCVAGGVMKNGLVFVGKRFSVLSSGVEWLSTSSCIILLTIEVYSTCAP